MPFNFSYYRGYLLELTNDFCEINTSSYCNKVQLDKVEKAFDTRVASALNRIGIASKHDVETLSAKLDGLTALLERVARKS